MTDITLSHTIEPDKLVAKLPKLPRLGLGTAFDAILKSYGDALAMAYVEPFQLCQRQEDKRI
jgi:hypothetical protein